MKIMKLVELQNKYRNIINYIHMTKSFVSNIRKKQITIFIFFYVKLRFQIHFTSCLLWVEFNLNCLN